MLIDLAESLDVASVTNAYYMHCESVTPSPQVLDDIAAERLWSISIELTGADFPVV